MPNKADRDLKHDRAVRDIAAARFAFPTKEQPKWRAFVNEPAPALGVAGLAGESLYPDIVVVDSGNVARMVAEVETADTVTEAEGRREWKAFAEVCETFYLYVPAGYSKEAKRICAKLGVRVTGIRTWRYIQGAEQLDLTEVY